MAAGVGYVVIEYNQASARPGLSDGELYDRIEDAREAAEVEQENANEVGRRERYKVAEVTLVEEDD
jgi:hypothetical protein